MGFGTDFQFYGTRVEPPGSHLASSSPSPSSSPDRSAYQKAIAGLVSHYPALGYREDLRTSVRLCPRPGRAAVLHLSNDTEFKVEGKEVLDEANKLEQQLRQKNKRTIVVMEGLDPDLVAVVGQEWQVDPRVFLQHKNNALWNMENETINAEPTFLPSMVPQREGAFNIHYPEIRYFEKPIGAWHLRCATTCRNIATTSIGRLQDQTGIVDHRASYWSQTLEDGGWRVLIIVDPPVREVIVGKPQAAKIETPAHVPFQGGYADIATWDSLAKRVATPAPPQTCMFDDVIHYFDHLAFPLDCTVPFCSTQFLLKVAAHKYLQVFYYTRGLFDQLQFQLDRRVKFAFHNPEKTLPAFWSDLHHFRRRIEYYTRHLSSIVLQLQADDTQGGLLSLTKTSSLSGCDRVEVDFIFLLRIFKELDARSGAIFDAYGVLASIASSQQSVLEASTTRNLQILATVFLPVAFAASFFSMNDQYIVGGPLFWVFIVVAIVMLSVVSCFTFAVRAKTRKWLRDRKDAKEFERKGDDEDESVTGAKKENLITKLRRHEDSNILKGGDEEQLYLQPETSKHGHRLDR